MSQVLFRAKWTIAQEIALRNCFQEEGQYIYVILVKGEHMQSRTYIFFKKVSASPVAVNASHEEWMSP